MLRSSPAQCLSQVGIWYLPTEIYQKFAVKLSRTMAPFGISFDPNDPAGYEASMRAALLRAHPDKGGDGDAFSQLYRLRQEAAPSVASELRRVAAGAPPQVNPLAKPAAPPPSASPPAASSAPRSTGWAAAPPPPPPASSAARSTGWTGAPPPPPPPPPTRASAAAWSSWGATSSTAAQTPASSVPGQTAGVESSTGYVSDPGVVAAHYYSHRMVRCSFPACVGRAAMYVKTNSGGWKHACLQCRQWYCPSSRVADIVAMYQWLAGAPSEVAAWNAMPRP